jgi:PASTA domain
MMHRIRMKEVATRRLWFVLVFLMLAACTQRSPQPSTSSALPPESVKVPNLVGMSLDQARQQLTDAGLRLGDVQVVTGTYTVAAITEQEPAAGTAVDRGEPVDVVMGPSRAEPAKYPRGPFERCPDVAGTGVPYPQPVEGVKRVALRFARAFLLGDWGTVRGLLDPSALPLRRS